MAGSPCIIEVALNGTTTKAANPSVPRSPAEITADALVCIAAGATIVHNHTDDTMWAPANRAHAVEPYVEAWTPILAAHPGVLTYATMASGGEGIAIADRWAHFEALHAAGVSRVGLVDPGALSLGTLDAEGLPHSADTVYINDHADARHMFARCGALGLAPSISIFEPGWLRVAVAVHEAGAMPRGAWVKLYFGGPQLPFGLPPSERSLDAYLAILEPTGLPWSVAVLGGDLLSSELADAALARGGHLRVGLEDYAGPGAPANLELVRRAAQRVAAAGRAVASVAETEAILGLS